MSTKTVVSMGELLLRLTSPDGTLLKDAKSLRVNYGGAEANVLMSLSSLGFQTRYLTRLGDDEISLAAKKRLQEMGVDTSFFASDPTHSPLGIYFVEPGDGPRASKVVYHRKHSAASQMEPSDFDFQKAFKGADIFYVSGITLEISPNSASTVLAAVKAAKKMGVKVIFDFNYRSKLISVEEAKKVYPEVAKLADIVYATPWDIRTLLGYNSDTKDDDAFLAEACKENSYEALFTKKRKILSPHRQSLLPIVYTPEGKTVGKEIEFDIFDRIGAGDAFSAGTIYGYFKDGGSKELALAYGLANSILAQTIFGDQAEFKEEDLKTFLASEGHGEVVR